MKGALKEMVYLGRLIQRDYADLMGKSEEELNAQEMKHWVGKLASQVHVDLMSSGVMSAGNRLAVEMLPREAQEEILIKAVHLTKEQEDFETLAANKALVLLSNSAPGPSKMTALPAEFPLVLRKDAPMGYPSDRIVNMDRVEIAIATLHRPGDTEWLSEEFYLPGGKNYIKIQLECPSGDLIGEYRNRIVRDALSLGCTHLFFVDDDLLVTNDALQRLYAHDLDVVGFRYCKKEPLPRCASMIKVGESYEPAPSSPDLLEIDWSLTAGGTLYRMDVFRKLEYPWFVSSAKGTEDTYFCARLREHGLKAYLDNTLTAGHMDKKTRKIYTET